LESTKNFKKFCFFCNALFLNGKFGDLFAFRRLVKCKPTEKLPAKLIQWGANDDMWAQAVTIGHH